MQREQLQRLIDDAERVGCAAFVFDGDEVEVAVAVEGETVRLEPGHRVQLSRVCFAGLV